MKKKEPLIEHLKKIFPKEDEKILRSLIIQKKVLVDNFPVTKAGIKIDSNSEIRIRREKKYLTRASVKLMNALDYFNLDVKGRIVIDCGCGMGGFTDILLKRGAAGVYAIDVGYSQFDYGLRNHPRITLMEKTNIRLVKKEAFDILPDFAVVDISFTSIKGIVEKIFEIITGEIIVALIKPQFEDVSHIESFDGIVRKKDDHFRILMDLVEYFKKKNIYITNFVPSVIKGRKGNQEFLAIFSVHKENKEIAEIIKNSLYK